MTPATRVPTLLVAAAFALLHLTLTPALWPVDETAHVAYADDVADGELPTIDEAIPSSLGIPGLSQRLAWEEREHRSGRQDIWTANHPPAPYVVQAVALRVGSLAGPSGALVAARATSVVWLLVAVALTGALARRLTGDDRAAALAALLMALTPTASHVAGLVFNDAAGIAMTTACLLVGVRAVQDGPSRRGAWWLAFVVGLSAATRVSVLPAVGVALGMAAWAAWRHRWPRREVVPATVLTAAALLPAALFWARNVWLYGSATASTALLEKFSREPNSPVADLLVDRWFWLRAWNRMWADLTTGHWAVWPRRGVSEMVLVAVAAGLAVVGWRAARALRARHAGVSGSASPGGRAGTWLVTARTMLRAVDPDVLVVWTGVLAVPLALLVSTLGFHSAGGSLHGRYLLGGHAVTTTVMAMALLAVSAGARWLAVSTVGGLALLEGWLLADLGRHGAEVWTRRGIPMRLPMPLGEATPEVVGALALLAAMALWLAVRGLWPTGTGIARPQRPAPGTPRVALPGLPLRPDVVGVGPGHEAAPGRRLVTPVVRRHPRSP